MTYTDANINSATAKLFNALIRGIGTEDREQTKGDSYADKLVFKGIIVKDFVSSREDITKEASDTLTYLYGINMLEVNSTFYKTISDVQNISTAERLADQVLHYLSTYGGIEELATDGVIYEPKSLDKDYIDELQKQSKELKIISILSKQQVADKVLALVSSNIALTKDDLEAIDTLVDNVKEVKSTINENLDNINNKEFLCKYALLNLEVPKDFDEFTRVMFYVASEFSSNSARTLLIKDRVTESNLRLLTQPSYSSIVNIMDVLITKYVEKYGIHEVAKNITRYHKQYLMIRKASKLKPLYNKIFRLSKKEYVPRELPISMRLADINLDDSKFAKLINNSSLSSLAKFYNYLSSVIAPNEVGAKFYNVRNGSSWGKVTPKDSGKDDLLVKARLGAIETAMIEKLKSKDGKDMYAYLSPRVGYTIPTSLKDSIGGIPRLTYVDFKSDVSIGISWDTEADLDLHAISSTGSHFGWNSDYGNDKTAPITYSGDMTHLNSEGYASEFYHMSLKHLTSPVTVSVSPYYAPDDMTFDMFMDGSDTSLSNKHSVVESIGENAVLVKNMKTDNRSQNILTVVPLTNENGDKVLRVIFNNKSTGVGRVPSVDDISKASSLDIARKAELSVDLKYILQRSGYTIVENAKLWKRLQSELEEHKANSKDDLPFTPDVELVDLSLSNLAKDSILSLEDKD